MADCESLIHTSEGDKCVLEACQHVVRALRVYNNNLDADFRKLLGDLETHLSRMTLETRTDEPGSSEIYEQLKDAEEKILSWESKQSMIWDTGDAEAAQYLEATYKIQTMLGSFRGFSRNANRKQKELCNRAETILEIAMFRLEKELRHILDQHKQYVQPTNMAVRSCGEDVAYDESFVSLEDDSIGEVLPSDSSNVEHDENIVELVHPRAIPRIKSIANAMFACSYNQEFCEAFISIRREALDEYLASLQIKKFSIENVLEMDWENLNFAIRRWIWVLKFIIRVYLKSEKRLCGSILGDFESIYAFCFIEISRASILSLLNFGEAVAMGSCTPEKLVCLLNMCEVLTDILPDVNHLLPGEAETSLRTEFHELLKKLGDSARVTFLKFKDAVASNESPCPFPGGGVHPLTRYVMNYFMLLAEYSDTLDPLLKDLEVDDLNGTHEPEKNGQDISPSTFSPAASHLRSTACILEVNLYRKASLYQDHSLFHIFKLNNLHYMVQKVKGSKLRLLFGDEWIRKHNAKFQQHATNYERATWSFMVSLLRDDSCDVSQSTLREKCRKFSIAFEDVYRSQTRWCIPDPQLRDDLRISSSLKVVQSYRGFLGRHAARIGEKYIRYTAEDLENSLLDLFEGSPRSLRGSWRR